MCANIVHTIGCKLLYNIVYNIVCNIVCNIVSNIVCNIVYNIVNHDGLPQWPLCAGQGATP